jgi:parvulin-like peptidyl-prolyl isomerase
MNKILFVFAISLIVCIQSFTQELIDNSVAKVGTIWISDMEFIERYELTPGLNRHRKTTTESQKIEFLFSLVAEKLWALEAASNKLDTTEVIRFTSTTFEKMFVRDALFKKEIKDKIIITDQELIEGLKNSSSKLYINYLVSLDSEEIVSLHKLLNEGIPFDSILSESPEKVEQTSPVEIVFGQMDESVEQVLFKLKIGEYTRPVLTPDGWYIFYLVNKSEEVLSSVGAKEDALKNVRKTIEARRTIEKQKEFYTQFFKDKKVDVEPVLFEKLASNISSLFEYKKINYAIKDGDLINLEPTDFLKLEEVLGVQLLSKDFILFDSDPISVKEYLRLLIFDGFNSKDYKINYIRASLNDRIRHDIEKELLSREGYKCGYQNLTEVKNELDMWNQHYLFEILKDQFRDSVNVSDKEVYDFYLKNHQQESYPIFVNIVEILTDSIEIAQKIFAELNSGADIKSLALLYNKREWTKKSGGEFGLFPITQHGEIGRIASTMNIGDVYGPIKIDEGYSIFKLIDKQQEKIIPPPPFEKFKEQYKQDLTYQQLYKQITDFTYKLAIKYGVELNLDLLEQIQVTQIPSFGIRFLGFGGKMTAVPLIAPNVDWAEQWIKHQQQPQINP